MNFGEALLLLGLDWPVSESRIRVAVRRRSLEHHPDRGGDPAKLRRVLIARDLLLRIGNNSHAFKRCSTCNRWRKRYEFYRDANRFDGLEPRCRLCSRARRRRRRDRAKRK